ncbi:unnamed protein product [Brassica oleracea]
MEDQSLETHLSLINKIAGNLARICISTSPGSYGMTTATGIKLGLERALLLRFIIFFRKPFTAAIQKDNPTALIFFLLVSQPREVGMYFIQKQELITGKNCIISIFYGICFGSKYHIYAIIRKVPDL